MTTKAPPRDCDHCGRRIGASRVHCLTETQPPAILCTRCLGRSDHRRVYPDCPDPWHDMHDHGLTFATRAAIPWLLDEGNAKVTKVTAPVSPLPSGSSALPSGALTCLDCRQPMTFDDGTGVHPTCQATS